jgi:hypothetical protein
VQIDAHGQVVPLEAPIDEASRSRPIWLSALPAAHAGLPARRV